MDFYFAPPPPPPIFRNHKQPSFYTVFQRRKRFQFQWQQKEYSVFLSILAVSPICCRSLRYIKSKHHSGGVSLKLWVHFTFIPGMSLIITIVVTTLSAIIWRERIARLTQMSQPISCSHPTPFHQTKHGPASWRTNPRWPTRKIQRRFPVTLF